MLKGRESEGGEACLVQSGSGGGRILEFGSVLEHVCQLLVLKVVHLEVILGASWRSIPVASWRSIWGTLGATLGSVRAPRGGLSGALVRSVS